MEQALDDTTTANNRLHSKESIMTGIDKQYTEKGLSVITRLTHSSTTTNNVSITVSDQSSELGSHTN